MDKTKDQASQLLMLFIQICIKYLPCVRHCVRHWRLCPPGASILMGETDHKEMTLSCQGGISAKKETQQCKRGGEAGEKFREGLGLT